MRPNAQNFTFKVIPHFNWAVGLMVFAAALSTASYMIVTTHKHDHVSMGDIQEVRETMIHKLDVGIAGELGGHYINPSSSWSPYDDGVWSPYDGVWSPPTCEHGSPLQPLELGFSSVHGVSGDVYVGGVQAAKRLARVDETRSQLYWVCSNMSNVRWAVKYVPTASLEMDDCLCRGEDCPCGCSLVPLGLPGNR